MKFRSCLAENGVTLPEQDGDGPPDGGGTGRAPTAPPEGADAGTAPPDGAPPAGSPADGARPDAAGSGDGATPPAPPGVDATAWDAALQACADLTPTRPS